LRFISKNPLTLSSDEVNALNAAEQAQNEQRSRVYYDKNTGKVGSYDALSGAQKTVLISISYQWGTYLKGVKSSSIVSTYNNMVAGKWSQVQQDLLNDSSKYASRRKQEGQVLKNNGWVDPNSPARCTAKSGTCTSSKCNGTVLHDLCPGLSNVVCCVDPSTSVLDIDSLEKELDELEQNINFD